jgi:parallel beta-helix repeat protein
MKKIALTLALALVLLCSLCPFYVNAQSPEVATINSDGSVTGTDSLRRNGNSYTFIGDIAHTLTIAKSNVVIDGAGFTLKGDSLEDPPEAIVLLNGVNSVTVTNLKIKGFGSAISIESTNNTVTGCTIDCQYGIWLRHASNNHITDNTFFNARPAIGFGFSFDNQLRNNRLINSTFSAGLAAGYSNDVDTSNTIDGKPIYYLVNKTGLVVSPENYPEIGYLILDSCTGITVKDLRMDGSLASGIILKETTNTIVTHNRLTGLNIGIYLLNSFNNTISNNYAANGTHGIVITATESNTVSGNTLEYNEVGISLLGNSQVIFLNNFINNTIQAYSSEWHMFNFKPLPNGVHVWDNGEQGNYWSNYAASDSNKDGVMDEPYIIDSVRNNKDHYPLAQPVAFPQFTEPTDPPKPNNQGLPVEYIIVVAAIAAFATITVLVYTRNKSSKRLTVA